MSFLSKEAVTVTVLTFIVSGAGHAGTLLKVFINRVSSLLYFHIILLLFLFASFAFIRGRPFLGFLTVQYGSTSGLGVFTFKTLFSAYSAVYSGLPAFHPSLLFGAALCAF